MPAKDLTKKAILEAFRLLANRGVDNVSSADIVLQVQASSATVKRYLDDLVQSGALTRKGKARSVRYCLSPIAPIESKDSQSKRATESEVTFPISLKSQILLHKLCQPLAMRTPVTYQRDLVEGYKPNETFLLPKDIAETLAKEGSMQDQQPAGTYARKVLEQLLIDLSWSSSKLEGNRFTLLATEELFQRGTENGDTDSIMLLNHKRAIEFLVDAVPEYGLTHSLIRNLHSLLMQDLMMNARGLGEIRTKVVNISDTVYIPNQVPAQLEQMLQKIINVAKRIKNPIEAAFFLWVNIAYLQPFEDGNKRTSRLAANIPLMLYNCAPLSFMDLNAKEYAFAMMGVYELLDMSLAADLFVWTYRRSIKKYAVVMESVGAPDPFRLKYREQLSLAVQQVLKDGKKSASVLHGLDLPPGDKTTFKKLLQVELATISVHNCARHRLSMKSVENWIKKGRQH